MPPAVISVSLQAAGFSIASTLLAQAITMYQAQKLSWIDSASLLSFMVIAVIMTPPNYFYQKFLEDSFPARPEKSKAADSQAKLSVGNTAKKFVLDQSLGAVANTLMFIVFVGMFKGQSAETVAIDVRRNLWPMVKAGWTFWPVVSLSNLVVVPFEYRMLVGNISGLLWGTYINLKMLLELST